MNPRRATESPSTSQNFDYSESETEPTYPEAKASKNGKRGSRAKSPAKDEPQAEAEEQDSEEQESVVAAEQSHSEFPSNVKDEDGEEEEDSDEDAFGADPPSPISRVVLDPAFEETTEPKSSPTARTASATNLSRGNRSSYLDQTYTSPRQQHDNEPHRNEIVVEDEDELVSQLDGGEQLIAKGVNGYDYDVYDGHSAVSLPLLSQAQLALSVAVSFMTAIDVWLFSGIRKQPFRALSTCLLIFGLLVFLTSPPTPSSNISSQIEYALRHAEASANKSLAQQQEALLEKLNPVVLQALEKIKEQDARLAQLNSLSDEMASLSQGVQELKESTQSQQYHANYRLNQAEQNLLGLRKEWKSDLEPLQTLFIDTRAQIASEINQLRYRVDETARIVSDREKKLEGLSASKEVILEWVDAKLNEFAQQQDGRRHDELSQYLRDRQLSAAQLLQIKEYLQYTDTPTGGSGDRLTASRVEEIAKRVAIDIGGRPDYALHSAGAEVVEYLTSPTYGDRVSSLGVFGKLVETLSGGPVAKKAQPGQALTLDLTPGSCWPMVGSQGNLTVQLARSITPAGVTIMHVPKELAHDPSRSSAPADFIVWSLRSDPQTNEIVREQLGRGRYELDKPAAQSFQLNRLDVLVQHVMFEFLSNHGHPDFTCLYRVSVH